MLLVLLRQRSSRAAAVAAALDEDIAKEKFFFLSFQSPFSSSGGRVGFRSGCSFSRSTKFFFTSHFRSLFLHISLVLVHRSFQYSHAQDGSIAPVLLLIQSRRVENRSQSISRTKKRNALRRRWTSSDVAVGGVLFFFDAVAAAPSRRRRAFDASSLSKI